MVLVNWNICHSAWHYWWSYNYVEPMLPVRCTAVIHCRFWLVSLCSTRMYSQSTNLYQGWPHMMISCSGFLTAISLYHRLGGVIVINIVNSYFGTAPHVSALRHPCSEFMDMFISFRIIIIIKVTTCMFYWHYVFVEHLWQDRWTPHCQTRAQDVCLVCWET